MLGVKRFQIPLAPAFAMTAHSSQGRTLKSVIVDLQIGRGVSVIASYVTMTRVKKKTDILIFRSFDQEVFNQGPPEGPSVLLKHLRGEYIDWKEIEDRYTPKRKCNGPCMLVRFKEDFFEREFRNTLDPHCKACVQKLLDAGTGDCGFWRLQVP